jgi:FixJ family two-component response regulator
VLVGLADLERGGGRAARRGPGARKRPPSGWEGLNPTERQVALLVAEGLSNPEIAQRLFGSRARVKTRPPRFVTPASGGPNHPASRRRMQETHRAVYVG